MTTPNEDLYAKLAEAQRMIWEAHCALEDYLDLFMQRIEEEADDAR